ncbi:hypothetical protein NEILACOT_04414 [Neisseria lactamica ATCC 23970]|uniref:Uncharacterized protein n=1 Tax=Neisseria lactamica ATCC 23970 TaxID=546265 RepID=D0WA45_NEILA|nr:hypothetical protein NEILACOT_04414 [Neisseria lactamica ATCC 23970]
MRLLKVPAFSIILNLFLLEPMKMVVLPRYIQNQEKTFGEL